MFNVGGGELLVILLVALIVLGPDKLPETARKIGNVVGEIRRMSAGFQNEMRSAMDDVNRPPAPKPTLEPVADDTTPTVEPEAESHRSQASDDSAA
ncbi:MAG TPA: Sec-independent protein translocase protein TatB [Acidimicrobiales bacterium]